MADRLEFGSRDWLQRLEQTLREVADRRTGEERLLEVTLCEVYRNPPRHLQPGGGSISWHASFTPGGATFAAGDAPEATIRIEGDYGALADLGRVVVEGDPAAQRDLDDRARVARRAGLLSIRNSLGFQPTFLGTVHDVMARLTT